ncbi:MAG TPA: flagellar motor protein [Terriglobia bacterium]|nr:flagellar motor protein [Terriglobia bacterium]
MDKATLGGIVVALLGIIGGMTIEGGKLAQILQPTAAMIVFGGTLGAVMIAYPLPVVMDSFKRLRQVLFETGIDPEGLIKEMLGYAQKARKEGIVALDNELENIQNPFLKKSLMLAIDGTEPQELRKMMELEMDNQSEQEERVPQVYEAAGGFAPTIGIIGAVLGLIQVMQHLNDIAEVGRGIAVAFVATIYGVASANIFFLPVAGKLKIRNRREDMIREMILEGVISILEGLNPRMVETKLRGFLAESKEKEKAKEKAEELEHAR